MKGKDIGILALIGGAIYLGSKYLGGKQNGETTASPGGGVPSSLLPAQNYMQFSTKNTYTFNYGRASDGVGTRVNPSGEAIATGKTTYVSVGGGTPLVFNAPTTTKGPGGIVYTPKRTLSERNVIVVK